MFAAVFLLSQQLVLAIVAPPAEVEHLSDYVTAHQRPLHIAMMIAIVTLFVVAWLLLDESARIQRGSRATDPHARRDTGVR